MNEYVFNYNQYKKSINKNNNLSFILIVLIIVFLLGFCIFLKPVSNKTETFFFVEIDNFQTYKQAQNLSQELQNLGTYSLIYFDKSYHVFVSFYSKEKDAKSVQEKLKNSYHNCSVVGLEFLKNFNDKNLTKNQISSLKNLIHETKKLVLILEDILNDFITNKTSYNKTNTLIKTYAENFIEASNKFFENFKTDSKYNPTKTHANSILNSISSLSNLEENSFTTKARYEIMKIATALIKITNCL